VLRLNLAGITLESLSHIRQTNAIKRNKFCAYVYRKCVPIRELAFESLNRYKPVDAPSLSKNNMQPIGESIQDKINFFSDYKFSFAFENSSYAGYTTEKLIESLISGNIPLYWGDPLVNQEFNGDAFLNYSNFNSLEDFANMVINVDINERLFNDMIAAPIFKENKIPDCANSQIIFNFFESILG